MNWREIDDSDEQRLRVLFSDFYSAVFSHSLYSMLIFFHFLFPLTHHGHTLRYTTQTFDSIMAVTCMTLS